MPAVSTDARKGGVHGTSQEKEERRPDPGSTTTGRQWRRHGRDRCRRGHAQVRQGVEHAHLGRGTQDHRDHLHGGVFGILPAHDLALDGAGRSAPRAFPCVRGRHRLHDVPRPQDQPQGQPYSLVRHRACGAGLRIVHVLRHELHRHPADGCPHRAVARGAGRGGDPGPGGAVPQMRGPAHHHRGAVPGRLCVLLADHVVEQRRPVRCAAQASCRSCSTPPRASSGLP